MGRAFSTRAESASSLTDASIIGLAPSTRHYSKVTGTRFSTGTAAKPLNSCGQFGMAANSHPLRHPVSPR